SRYRKGMKMMPVVRLNDATFVDLKSIATWVGSRTPSETIDQLVKEKMAALDLERDVEPESSVENDDGDHLVFDKTPGLSFTKVMSADVEGKALRKPNWASILLAVIAALKSRGMSGEKLVRELQVPSKATDYDEDGYRFHPELGISVQGQSAPDAWKEASRIAAKHKIPLKVVFQWRDNEKAQYPGRTGVLRAGRDA
ncbi:T4SS efffector SepA family protein, partial [Aquicoccus sp.]|uniref:T4SS efffector SepA family protein n=1 Tax=Aquicoccus sp. TaxID=2055851 RepID=UPI00356430AC